MPMQLGTDVQNELKKYTQKLNQGTLNSIAKLGIVPFSKIKDCLASGVGFGSDETQSNVCVNFIQLDKCKNKKEQSIAIKTALWEEYTGVFGISLERPWPLQFPQQHLLIAEQIKLRLCNNVIFVLSPPTNPSIIPYKINSDSTIDVCYEYQTNLPFKQVSADGYNQSRGEFLIDYPECVTTKVTEIKTKHEFSIQEMIAILVPTDLIDLVQNAFKGKDVKIIPVPMTSEYIALRKIPEILKTLHGQCITEGSFYLVPDYESVLTEQISPAYKRFSLHAVRLQTDFDIQIRYIENISFMMDNIKKTQAKIVAIYQQDNSGWIFVHASKLLKLNEKRMQEIQKHLPQYKRSDASIDLKCRDELLNAKGSCAMINYYDKLNDRQQEGLFGLGVKAIYTLYGTILSVPDKHKEIIKANLEQAVVVGLQIILEKSQKAAVKIQSLYRGGCSRELFKQYKSVTIKYQMAEKQLALAQEMYNVAEQQLKVIGKKLRP